LSEESKRKIEEYLKRIESAKTDEEYIRCISQFRTYLSGVVDYETDPFWSTIGYAYIGILRMSETLHKFALNLSRKLSELEKRIKRIEDELNFRERYK
jgi:hypothetical protein